MKSGKGNASRITSSRENYVLEMQGEKEKNHNSYALENIFYYYFLENKEKVDALMTEVEVRSGYSILLGVIIT